MEQFMFIFGKKVGTSTIETDELASITRGPLYTTATNNYRKAGHKELDTILVHIVPVVNS